MYNHCQVWLEKCPDYQEPKLTRLISVLLNSLLTHKKGKQETTDLPKTILIKPNFISRKNSALCCSHPLVIRAVASYFHDIGRQVVIADSPAFGRATRIAQELGLPQICQGLNVKFTDFQKQRTLKLACGNKIRVAEEMLSAELIINLPKLKVHRQLGLTGAVKNCFGSVPGIKKALAHVHFGKKPACFARMLLSISAAFPQSIHLADGILAMHQDGPINGQGYPLGLIAGSLDPVALDTALGTIVGLSPQLVPVWQEACRQNLPGAFVKRINFPRYMPQDFPCPGFKNITKLQPISFHPWQLAKSSVQRLTARW